MKYRVASYFGRGTDQPCAQFKVLADAELFIEKKMKVDADMKLIVIYRLYDLSDLVKEYSPGKGVPPSGSTLKEKEQTQGSQGKGSTASFRPTPFNTTPRPAGTPQKWLIEPDEDSDKKDKS